MDSQPWAHSPSSDKEGEVATSATFNASDADVVFRSTDDVLFRVHKKNLDFASDGFPPSEFSSDNQVVDLSEDSETLELMFRFVYPRLLPPLEGVPFDVLAPLAEAVEKYQIHMGMKLCNIYMSQALPGNAITVLDYAIKHSYPELANRAAPYVTLPGLSHSTAINAVSPELLRRWLPYYNRWAEAIRVTTNMYTNVHPSHNSGPYACSAWLTHQRNILASLANVAGLKNDMTIPLLIVVPPSAQLCCVNQAESWRNDLTQRLAQIPPFVKL